MSDLIKVSDIRSKFPMYGDMSDEQLIGAVRRKFYADIPMNDFVKRIDFDTERARLDPTIGMSGVDKFLAGTGKAFADVGRGVGQLVGLVPDEDVNEAKKRDTPLMSTGAGMAGNVTGNVAMALPTAAIPGAAGLRGAAAIGAGLGFLQPVAEGESRALNTGIGGAAGAGGVALGRALMGGAQAGKALVEPFYQGGRDKIAGRVLQRFMNDPSKLAAASSRPTATGALPTLAEQTGDAGLARLQDALRAVDPQINNQITGRLADNNAARVAALQSLTGSGGQREFFAASRNAAANDLYGRAFGVPIVMDDLSPAMRGELTKLQRMPAIREALKTARVNASNFGMKPTAEGNIAGLHQAKLAMDDAISKLSGGGAVEANKAAGIRAARDRLVTFMEKMSPDYAEARATYAAMSRPINAMDVGEEIARRATSNTSDLAGNPRMQANALLGALRDEKGLVQRATGRKGLGELSDVFDPQQLNLLRSVAAETDRAAAVASAGNGPGSATAQRMASQNILSRLVGPTGLPQSWAESALANTIVGKPLNLVYGGVAEPKIQQALAGAVLDPDSARAVLQAAQAQGIKLPQSVLTQLLLQASRAAPASLALSQPEGR